MPLLLADFIYSRDCKLNLRKNVDTTGGSGGWYLWRIGGLYLFLRLSILTKGPGHMVCSMRSGPFGIKDRQCVIGWNQTKKRGGEANEEWYADLDHRVQPTKRNGKKGIGPAGGRAACGLCAQHYSRTGLLPETKTGAAGGSDRQSSDRIEKRRTRTRCLQRTECAWANCRISSSI